ncbi:hypothetical protein A3D71_01970 [Candidatus Kaiserbacteria bacterium RIFCSPHIGHO2_02_FULL_55_20]|uniref:Uncharacterized protein n=1 Tax=Candidatus Kaiserbacteria bacterium RIFCSPHIGHO2_02_FULL_55_20 TaxID=1798497 RepID=A0A1F6DX46_9BACT|nr:MAG: hypothetical protein A2680_02830 [Candidatus Kaiserbacteria bacterium RIFCSPHIGHO2_01_FULL_55_37]OGG65966.1 MAG: hypothetical protein A3D71_01970 [Candidatus Kaiserbacteria bacterium RIFCSPHIGHO2_02_FULL_55_20]
MKSEHNYLVGEKIRIKSLNIEGYLVWLYAGQGLICSQNVTIDASIKDSVTATKAAMEKVKAGSGGQTCTSVSGVTGGSADIEVIA